MAVEIGTATGHEDLYEKLISFLTTNADLAAAGQNWTKAWEASADAENPTDIVLRGPGLSGQDQVYVCLRLNQEVAADAYWIQARGATGVIGTAADYTEHVNVTPQLVRMFADSGVMSYWFVANGRRFMVVVKISTVFQAMYCGLFLPYATPLSYPYPMFIGGSTGPQGYSGSPTNWRSEADNHRHYVSPQYHSGGGSDEAEALAWMLTPAGSWQRVSNFGYLTDAAIAPERFDGNYFAGATDNESYHFDNGELLLGLMDCFGGTRILIPCTLIQRSPDSQTFGILDGAYRCQGVANAAENIITQGGIDHLVVQNVFRSNFNDFWAMGLD